MGKTSSALYYPSFNHFHLYLGKGTDGPMVGALTLFSLCSFPYRLSSRSLRDHRRCRCLRDIHRHLLSCQISSLAVPARPHLRRSGFRRCPTHEIFHGSSYSLVYFYRRSLLLLENQK